MKDEKWSYIVWNAKKNKTRFLKCEGILYEVNGIMHPNGTKWSVEEVDVTEIPDFKDDD